MPSAMQCPAENELAEFLSGQLNTCQTDLVESHLANCSPCNETLRGLTSADTFNDLAAEAFSIAASDGDTDSSWDGSLINEQVDRATMQLILSKAKHWSISNPPLIEQPETTDLAIDAKAREIEAAFNSVENGQAIGQFGLFKIEQRLGAGSSGVVYLATDTSLSRKVAIKILRPSLGDAAKARFLTEAKATAAMDHPNVVSIYQVGIQNGLAFIAMKWTAGETLAARLNSEVALSECEIRKICSQIALGLSAAHDNGLIHRDIKPANIWLESATGDVKILDFGLVRAADENLSLTLTGMLAGTPSYMSPEQSRGGDIDARSDLFSLGCVLYQMLTGKLPFQGSNVLSMLQAIQNDHPTHPQDIDSDAPGELAALAMSLLQKAPGARPPSAAAVSEAFQSDSTKWSFSPCIQPRRTNGIASNWKKTAAAVACLVAACFIGFACLLAPQIIRIATNQGQLVIETSDPDVKIQIVGSDGNVLIVDLQTDQQIDIKAGNYELKPLGENNSIVLDRETLIMSRGGKEVVRVSKVESSHHDVANDYFLEESATGESSAESRHEGLLICDMHVLQPGDIVGVYIEGQLELPKGVGGLLFPLMINAHHELTCTEFDPINVRGRKVGELPVMIRAAVNLGNHKNKLPTTFKIDAKLLRARPGQSEVPSTETEIIPFAPSHSAQVQVGLRAKELFRLALIEDFGTSHPSVVANSRKIEAAKSFLKDVESAELKIIEDKLMRLDFLESKTAEKEAAPSVAKEIRSIRRESHELIKAQLVKDFNWILLDETIPAGLSREERSEFLRERVDLMRKRGNQKLDEYRRELIAGNRNGWGIAHPRGILLRSYIRMLPRVIKNLEQSEAITSETSRQEIMSDQRQPDANETAAANYDQAMQELDLLLTETPSSEREEEISLRFNFLDRESGLPLRQTTVHIIETTDDIDEQRRVNKELEVASSFTAVGFLPNGKSESPERVFNIYAKSDGYASDLHRFIIGRFNKGEQTVNFDIEFEKAHTLTGTVVDHLGNPVEGAIVYDLKGLHGDPVEGYTTGATDQNGKFVINDLAAFDEHQTNGVKKFLSVRHPDFGPQLVDVGNIPRDIRIQLDPVTRVKFQMIDSKTK